jgi:hypothetical protein
MDTAKPSLAPPLLFSGLGLRGEFGNGNSPNRLATEPIMIFVGELADATSDQHGRVTASIRAYASRRVKMAEATSITLPTLFGQTCET